MKKKDIAMIAGVLIAAILLALAQIPRAAVATGAWGLSFQKEGQAPSAPADRAQLLQYDCAYMGSGEEKVLFLTFDAGYENGHTEKILDVLKKHQISATFFLVGSYLERNADLVRRMVDEGHIVGNHTLHHRDMSRQSPEEFAAELTGMEALFLEITGKELPKYYRPPQGIYSEENLKQAQQLGYKTVFWSLAYADWDNNAQPSREYAFSKLMPRTHNGAVVLLHSTSQTNADILDALLTRWKQEGYSFAPISQLFP